MSKWSLLLIWSIPMLNSAFAYNPKVNVTIYGDDAYPPYSYVQKGEIKGIYVDILAAAFTRMPHYSVTIEPLPWKRGLKMLQVGEGFALFPPYYYSDRRSYISPYSEPILKEEVVVMCRPETIVNRRTQNWPADYHDLTIGVNESYALGGNAFWQAIAQGDMLIKEAKSNRASMTNLYKHRIDCYMNDRLSILWELKLMKDEGMIEQDWTPVIATSVSSEHGYLGYTHDPNNRFQFKEDFVLQFNQALKEIKTDGTMNNILDAYRVPTN